MSDFITTGDGRFCCRLEDYKYHKPIVNNDLIGNQLRICLKGGYSPDIKYDTPQEVYDAAQRLTDSISEASKKPTDTSKAGGLE